MLFIDWLHLDWVSITAWCFGILLGVYLIVILKNYFYRWSSRPPNLIYPSKIQISKTQYHGVTQTILEWDGAASDLNSITIWTRGRIPRFLLNLALALSLHAKSVIVYEVMQSAMGAIEQQITSQTTAMYYGAACHLIMEGQEISSSKVILINPTIPLNILSEIRSEEKYILLGRRVGVDQVNLARMMGFTVVNLHGGMKFKGREMTLLGELVQILKAGEHLD